MNLKRNVFITSLFFLSLTLGGCSLFNNNGDKESDDSKKLNKEAQVTPENTSFEDAYASFISPMREKLKTTVSKITEYKSISENLSLDVNASLKTLGLSGDFNIKSEGKSSNGGSLKDTKSVNDISVTADASFKNPRTKKTDNIKASGDAELKVVNGKVFGMLSDLNISSSNPQYQMISAFAKGVKNQWVMFGNMINQSNVNIDASMNPYEVYDFVDRIAGYIEDNPIFEKTGESMENGQKVYDIALSNNNIVSIYKNIMNDDFVNKGFSQMSGTNKQKMIERQAEAIKSVVNGIDLNGNMTISKENGIVLNIESITFQQNKNVEVSGKISNKNGIYQGNIDIEDPQKNANIEFDNMNNKFNFNITFSRANNSKADVNIDGYIMTDMKDEDIYSELSISVKGAFGKVDVMLEDTVNKTEEFDVKAPENYKKLQELMQGMMGGMGAGSGQMPSQGGGMQQPQQVPGQGGGQQIQVPSQGKGGENVQKQLTPEQKQKIKEQIKQQGGSSSQMKIKVPQDK